MLMPFFRLKEIKQDCDGSYFGMRDMDHTF